MDFRKYQHIERFGTSEVEHIEVGNCYCFPKIDGTNSQVWLGGDGNIHAGSRNRELTLEKDNQGFYEHILKHEGVAKCLNENPKLRLYGEWLCLSGDTIIRKTSGGKNSNNMTLRDMYKYSITPTVETSRYVNKNGENSTTLREPWWIRYGMPSIFSLYLDEDKIKPNKISQIHYSGDKEVYKVTTRKGFSIKSTLDHPFFTPHGFVQLRDLRENDCVAVTDFHNKPTKRTYGKGTNKIFKKQEEYRNRIGKCEMCGISNSLELHHKDGNHLNNDESNFQVLCRECHRNSHTQLFKGFEYNYEFDKIISIEYVGIEDCYDITMCGEENVRNYVANGFIVHNCPHSLRTYRDDCWRKFYVFDVVEELGNDEFRYLPYEEYRELCEKYGIDYLPPIAIINNPSYENLIALLDRNVFLIKDGCGVGEGIVIKRYNYKNKYGRTTWAKIVTSEFKEKHAKVMRGGNSVEEGKKMIEQTIVDKYVTTALCEKVYAKIVAEKGEWKSQFIPMLLNMVYYDLVREDCWNFVKENKYPTINFKTLIVVCNEKVKSNLPNLF